MNGFLQWPCAVCSEAIADGEGGLIVDEEAAKANRRIAEGLELETTDAWTHGLQWLALHHDCPHSYWDKRSLRGWKVENIRTEMNLLWVSYTIASKPHLRYANSATMLYNAICRLRPRDPLTQEQRKRILERDDFACRACGFRNRSGKRLHVDHIYPVALGGSDYSVNLQVLCDRCNLAKGMTTMERFLEEHGLHKARA